MQNGDRSGEILEPLLTKQWFVDAKKLAKNAIQKVKNKETNFYQRIRTKHISMDERYTTVVYF